MRDLRVNVWNTVTIAADGATNGVTIDLLADYVGDYLWGTGDYGLGIEIMGKNVVTGTGDGFTVTFKWQHSPDNANWHDLGQIGVFTIDTNGAFLLADGTTVSSLTRQILKTRTESAQRYLRIVATAAGITNGESIDISAFLADGTVDAANAGTLF